MDSPEHDIEVLRQALIEEEALHLSTGTTAARRMDGPAAPAAAPADRIDLEKSTDALREALEAETRSQAR